MALNGGGRSHAKTDDPNKPGPLNREEWADLLGDPEREEWEPLTGEELENPGDVVIQAGSRLLKQRRTGSLHSIGEGPRAG